MDAPVVRFLDVGATARALRPQLDAAYARVMDSGRFVHGDELTRFEQAFATFTGCRFALGVGNGLDALSFALEAVGVQAGDEVIVPAHTFIATWLAVSMLGAVPVAVQPAPGGFNVDAAGIEGALSPRTRAVIVVHLYGEPVDAEPIERLCADRGLALVEDAAQAHGARRHGRPVGSMGQAAAFSFYPGKNLGAFGDGGAVTTSDPAVAERVQRLRNYGALARYDHVGNGRNSRLDALQAAFLLEKLAVLPAWNARRCAVARAYEQGLQGIPGLGLPASLPGNEPVWHLYVVRTAAREALAASLAADGIETQVHYPRAVCRCGPFAPTQPAHRTTSDGLADEVLSLPMGPHLSDADVGRVIVGVQRFFR